MVPTLTPASRTSDPGVMPSAERKEEPLQRVGAAVAAQAAAAAGIDQKPDGSRQDSRTGDDFRAILGHYSGCHAS